MDPPGYTCDPINWLVFSLTATQLLQKWDFQETHQVLRTTVNIFNKILRAIPRRITTRYCTSGSKDPHHTQHHQEEGADCPRD